MKNKRIMFDVDGVLADFALAFTTEANRLDPSVPITSTVNQPTWNMRGLMSKELVNKVWCVVEKDPHWWGELKPCVPDSVFDDLFDLKIRHDVTFCTGRDPTHNGKSITYQTGLWLFAHGVGHPAPVIASKNKGEIARALGAQYAIDDRASNAAMVHWLANGTCSSYILDRPYNRNVELPEKVRRVGTVEEFLEDVKKGR